MAPPHCCIFGLKQYSINLSIFLGTKKDIENRVQPTSLGAHAAERNTWNTAERILAASPCTDTTARTYRISTQVLHSHNWAWHREKLMPLMMDVFNTCAADFRIPSGERCLHLKLHIILIYPVHLSNLLSTFWIIILLSNVQSHICSFLCL